MDNGLQIIEPKRTQKAKKVSLPINMEKKLADDKVIGDHGSSMVHP